MKSFAGLDFVFSYLYTYIGKYIWAYLCMYVYLSNICPLEKLPQQCIKRFSETFCLCMALFSLLTFCYISMCSCEMACAHTDFNFCFGNVWVCVYECSYMCFQKYMFANAKRRLYFNNIKSLRRTNKNVPKNLSVSGEINLGSSEVYEIHIYVFLFIKYLCFNSKCKSISNWIRNSFIVYLKKNLFLLF